MKRTTISLPDDLAEALEREAHRRHSSASAVTREALETHLGLQSGRSRSLPFAAVGRSGGGSTARDMEQRLEREWDEHDPGGR
jgi:predicted transcriptional regulator